MPLLSGHIWHSDNGALQKLGIDVAFPFIQMPQRFVQNPECSFTDSTSKVFCSHTKLFLTVCNRFYFRLLVTMKIYCIHSYLFHGQNSLKVKLAGGGHTTSLMLWYLWIASQLLYFIFTEWRILNIWVNTVSMCYTLLICVINCVVNLLILRTWQACPIK